LESGPIKKSAPAKKQFVPTSKDKAALRAVLKLLPPKLEPHLDKLGLEVIDTSLVTSGRNLIVKFTIDHRPTVNSDSADGGNPLAEETTEDATEDEQITTTPKEFQTCRKNKDHGQPRTKSFGSMVTIDDCAAVSRIISDLLDELDPEPGPKYSLEVSSPGLDRPLRNLTDFVRFQGSLVKLKLSLEGRTSRHTGRLATDPLRLITDQGEISFNLEAVISARLVPEI
jgi:ribosome maturation factor RimP